jgi:putative thioredoxin
MGLFSFLKKGSVRKRAAIIDVSDASFKKQVIQRSYKTPVLVDYWAAWCGPCRQLGPVLEKIAEEPDGDFILAKLNTEHNPRTARQYNISSIPNVKVFRNGQMVDEFRGALPEPLVRRFIDRATSAEPPSPRIKGNADPQQRLQQAEQHLRKGRGFEAFVILNDFPESVQTERAEQLLPLAHFLFDMDDGDGITGVDSLDEQNLDAAAAMGKRKPAAALDHLLAALDAGEAIDRAHTIEVIESLFALLGENHKITAEYREKLSVSAPATASAIAAE